MMLMRTPLSNLLMRVFWYLLLTMIFYVSLHDFDFNIVA